MIKVIDTRNDFRNFLEQRKHMDAREAYKRYYVEPNRDILEGLTVTHTLERVHGLETALQSISLDRYEKQFDKLCAKEFFDQTEAILRHAEERLPLCTLFPLECYMVFGFNTMNGSGTFVKDKPVIAIGLEQVAEYDSAKEYQDLLVHELHHLVRFSQFNVMEELAKETITTQRIDLELAAKITAGMNLKDSLILEGLAVVAPAVIEGEELTEARLKDLLFYTDELYSEIVRRKDELWAELMTEWDRSDRELIYKWTYSGSYVQQYNIPQRSLYYLGAKLVIDLMREKQVSFSKLTTMTAHDILQLAGFNI